MSLLKMKAAVVSVTVALKENEQQAIATKKANDEVASRFAAYKKELGDTEPLFAGYLDQLEELGKRLIETRNTMEKSQLNRDINGLVDMLRRVGLEVNKAGFLSRLRDELEGLGKKSNSYKGPKGGSNSGQTPSGAVSGGLVL